MSTCDSTPRRVGKCDGAGKGWSRGVNSTGSVKYCTFLKKKKKIFIELLPIFRTWRIWIIHLASYIFVYLWEMLTSRIKKILKKYYVVTFELLVIWLKGFCHQTLHCTNILGHFRLHGSFYFDCVTLNTLDKEDTFFSFFNSQQKILITKVPFQKLLVRFDHEL